MIFLRLSLQPFAEPAVLIDTGQLQANDAEQSGNHETPVAMQVLLHAEQAAEDMGNQESESQKDKQSRKFITFFIMREGLVTE